jgi:RNA polymerase sigma-70 factor, ECF subfamily
MNEGTGGDASARADGERFVNDLVSAHGAALRDLCRRVLRDDVLAEDVLQQVLLEAHRDARRFQARAALRTWLLSIAWHRCQDALKARRRYQARVTTDDDEVIAYRDPAHDPEVQLQRQRLGEALRGALAALSDDARAAIGLRFSHGLSYEQMATLLGEKPDTLHARVTRAVSALRRELARQGWDS